MVNTRFIYDDNRKNRAHIRDPAQSPQRFSNLEGFIPHDNIGVYPYDDYTMSSTYMPVYAHQNSVNNIYYPVFPQINNMGIDKMQNGQYFVGSFPQSHPVTTIFSSEATIMANRAISLNTGYHVYPMHQVYNGGNQYVNNSTDYLDKGSNNGLVPDNSQKIKNNYSGFAGNTLELDCLKENHTPKDENVGHEVNKKLESRVKKLVNKIIPFFQTTELKDHIYDDKLITEIQSYLLNKYTLKTQFSTKSLQNIPENKHHKDSKLPESSKAGCGTICSNEVKIDPQGTKSFEKNQIDLQSNPNSDDQLEYIAHLLSQNNQKQPGKSHNLEEPLNPDVIELHNVFFGIGGDAPNTLVNGSYTGNFEKQFKKNLNSAFSLKDTNEGLNIDNCNQVYTLLGLETEIHKNTDDVVWLGSYNECNGSTSSNNVTNDNHNDNSNIIGSDCSDGSNGNSSSGKIELVDSSFEERSHPEYSIETSSRCADNIKYNDTTSACEGWETNSDDTYFESHVNQCNGAGLNTRYTDNVNKSNKPEKTISLDIDKFITGSAKEFLSRSKSTYTAFEHAMFLARGTPMSKKTSIEVGDVNNAITETDKNTTNISIECPWLKSDENTTVLGNASVNDIEPIITAKKRKRENVGSITLMSSKKLKCNLNVGEKINNVGLAKVENRDQKPKSGMKLWREKNPDRNKQNDLRARINALAKRKGIARDSALYLDFLEREYHKRSANRALGTLIERIKESGLEVDIELYQLIQRCKITKNTQDSTLPPFDLGSIKYTPNTPYELMLKELACRNIYGCIDVVDGCHKMGIKSANKVLSDIEMRIIPIITGTYSR
ncbi:hypothetical protein AX774_g465 [Zancudomyces culisetae]|uniref:DUF3020 domain-containing protein n=1 Tax=Zancudomyces culisetae TaxID=1213189 RepID=A0A1R1PYH5_ZANCU|nr:hypothetical protein AX774_g465 [Zancudomyces culisetae]|eukprot:OMH86001.1 hypothetical protein AX774_g465 [Zancudomyces culisetae]